MAETKLPTLLRRSPSKHEIQMSFLALRLALVSDIDEVAFVRRLEGKDQTLQQTSTDRGSLPEFLTVNEFARLTKRSRSSIYNDLKAKRLPSVLVGPRARRIPASALENLQVQALSTVVAPPEQKNDNGTQQVERGGGVNGQR